MSDEILHLSSVVGSPLVDSSGERLGRIDDVVIRLDGSDQLPPVVGLRVNIGGRGLFVPIGRIESLEPTAARVSTTKLNLAQFERRPGEVLLAGDVLDRSLIDVTHARLVTAREVEMACSDGVWRVAGIDPRFSSRLRRLRPHRLRSHEFEGGGFIAWSDTEPFVGHVPTSRLHLGARRLALLHPAQIADLVEAASHEEGEEILEAVGQDKELEADVFEELDDEHQVEFLEDRRDEEIADVLSRMESDDAADLLLQLDQDRRLPILGLLPAAEQRKVRSLLGFNPSTAGGLMSPDFVTLKVECKVADALAALRRSDLPPRQLAAVMLVDDDGVLQAAVSLIDLVRAAPEQSLGDLVESSVPTVAAERDLPEVARLMTDYNLVTLPVIDSSDRPIGLIAVDDVLEELIPAEWRRRAGHARD